MVQNKVKDTRRPGAPGWKGPGYVPKVPSRHINPHSKEARAIAAANAPQWTLPFELQQLLLNIFRNSYSDVLASDDLIPTLQEIKNALFERDFARAFGQQRYLEAYTARWSPSRALCYGSALVDLRAHFDHFSLFAQSERSWKEQEKANRDEAKGVEKDAFDSCTSPPTRVVCIGGGAAEVVAFGGALRYMLSSSGASATESPSDKAEELPDSSSEQEIMDSLARATAKLALPSSTPLILDLHLIDSADWSSVTSTLATTLTTPPPLSKYASAAARATNSPLLPPSSMITTFHQHDVLSLSAAALAAITTPPDAPRPCIVTLLFTLNELYTASIARTTALLLKLTLTLIPGSVLLVVDSPGSYSEAAVGSAKEGEERKKYPMSWLLDHALLPKEMSRKEREEARRRAGDGEVQGPEWEKVLGEEARWFRLREGLGAGYPIGLENMRYQVHVFRRL